MSERYTLRELIDKVDWEGGLDAAIDYGISSGDVPKEIEELWRLAEAHYEAFDAIRDKIYDYFELEDNE